MPDLSLYCASIFIFFLSTSYGDQEGGIRFEGGSSLLEKIDVFLITQLDMEEGINIDSLDSQYPILLLHCV